MSATTGKHRVLTASVVSLVSRVLLALIFIHEGIFLVLNFETVSASMVKLGVPGIFLVPTIALQLVAGAAMAVGWQVRLAATALGLFCLMTAFSFHTNFDNRNELLHFEKDLAIAGGMFVLALSNANGGGWFRRRRIVRP
ncbi:MAG: DoxX family protein [Rhizobiales bacterium]|nr:DoxX family protein [Hyphomicrobiales bacterium]